MPSRPSTSNTAHVHAGHLQDLKVELLPARAAADLVAEGVSMEPASASSSDTRFLWRAGTVRVRRAHFGRQGLTMGCETERTVGSGSSDW